MLGQVLIGAGKMLAAEKSGIGRKWRGMRSLKQSVVGGINALRLISSMAAPQKKNQMTALFS
jgi:hypothetical protein